MSVQIIECEQGTPEWFAARAGIPTASCFSTVMAKGKTAGAKSVTREKYMRELAGEIITGKPKPEGYSNGHMERGKEMEGEARNFYAFMQNVEPELVGFIRNGQKGASPDSLIGTDGMLEIKTKTPALMIECMERGSVVPPEHVAQCQGGLWVAEREWIDFCAYFPGMPPFIVRSYRDEAYIANLSSEVDRFNDELAALVERIRRWG